MPVEMSNLFAAAGVLVAGVFGFLNYKAMRDKKRLEDDRHRIEEEKRLAESALGELQSKIAKHFQSIISLEYVYQDVVLIGPRASGKSALAKLWTQPWFDISRLQQNAIWEVCEKDICPLESWSGKDAVFDLSRSYQKIFRVRIHDYPGSDDQRHRAIKALPELQNTVLLFLLHSPLQRREENALYYCKTFIDSFEEVPHLSRLVTKVIVVFSRIDELEDKSDCVAIRDRLVEANAAVIARLRGVFSDRMECIAVSSLTNENLIHLLGTACSPALPEEAKRKFRDHIDRLNRVISTTARDRLKRAGVGGR